MFVNPQSGVEQLCENINKIARSANTQFSNITIYNILQFTIYNILQYTIDNILQYTSYNTLQYTIDNILQYITIYNIQFTNIIQLYRGREKAIYKQNILTQVRKSVLRPSKRKENGKIQNTSSILQVIIIKRKNFCRKKT